MSDAPPPDSAKAETLFGLSGDDADLLEQVCGDMLGTGGVDTRRLFAALRQGKGLGAALGLTPELLEVLYSRAHRWFVAGRPDRAEPLFRALCSADAKVSDYWIGMGICLRMRGDYAGASLAFSMAGSLRPDWAVPAFHAAELALQQRDHTQADAQIARFRRLADETTPSRMREDIDRMERAVGVQRATER